VVDALVFLAWPALYQKHVNRGYEQAAAQGRVTRDFTSSPRALRDAAIAFTAFGAIVGFALRQGPKRLILWSWAGVVLGLCSIFVWSPADRASNLAPLALPFFAMYTTPFLLAALIVRRLKTSSHTAV